MKHKKEKRNIVKKKKKNSHETTELKKCKYFCTMHAVPKPHSMKWPETVWHAFKIN